MMPWWDLFPGETATLADRAAAKVPATYLTSSARRRHFEIEGVRIEFTELDNGALEYEGEHYVIQGKPRNTRHYLEPRPARYPWDRTQTGGKK